MSGSSRYLARSSTVQALYQWDMTGQNCTEIERSFIPNRALKGAHLEYFRKLIGEIPIHCQEIDESLAPHQKGGAEKVDIIEKTILRLGAYELMFEKDVPVNVIIDQAIDLAKTFASENSYKYINGVLDKLARSVRVAAIAADVGTDAAADVTS